MKLFHFTSAHHINGIGRFGLTVGDVPTDLDRGTGRCGVWFTTAESPHGHGLQGSSVDKKRYRLSVEIPEGDAKLFRWSDWSATHATADTVQRLAVGDGAGADTWFVYFGVVGPEQIGECVDTTTGEEVENWAAILPASGEPSPGVPPWRRDAWHKALLKRTSKWIQQRQTGRTVYLPRR